MKVNPEIFSLCNSELFPRKLANTLKVIINFIDIAICIGNKYRYSPTGVRIKDVSKFSSEISFARFRRVRRNSIYANFINFYRKRHLNVKT